MRETCISDFSLRTAVENVSRSSKPRICAAVERIITVAVIKSSKVTLRSPKVIVPLTGNHCKSTAVHAQGVTARGSKVLNRSQLSYYFVIQIVKGEFFDSSILMSVRR